MVTRAHARPRSRAHWLISSSSEPHSDNRAAALLLPTSHKLTGKHFSVSSGIGFLTLFGVSAQTGVFMLEYINQLRGRGYAIVDAAIEGAVLRLRADRGAKMIAAPFTRRSLSVFRSCR